MKVNIYCLSYLMVLLYIISVIVTEHTISYTEIHYLANRSCIQFAVLYRPNVWQLPITAIAALNIYSSHLCFHTFNHNHDTKEFFMSHSVPVSLCALFTPLQHSIHYSNAMKDSQPAKHKNPPRPCNFCVENVSNNYVI